MKSAASAPPSLAKVAAALHLTTEILARELTAPTDGPPPWTEFEWHIARAASAMQGVSTLLCDALRWDGPESWRRFLWEQREQSVLRHLRVSRLLDAIDRKARDTGMALVALKGSALIAQGIYGCGQRPMGDVDLLVRPEDASALVRSLALCGYATAFTTRRHRVLQPEGGEPPQGPGLGEHVDYPLKIEVHTRIAEHLPVEEIDITDCLWPTAAHPGINAYPSAASLMLHLALHAAGNMRARALRLVQLHDMALLAARFGAAEWQAFRLTAGPDERRLWWAYAPLALVDRYYPGSVPTDLLAELAPQCPRLLLRRVRRRRLTDMSWSNIRIAAFPGVEWSRTPREALQFVIGRICPSREARLELRDGAAQIPAAETIPWYGLAHGARVLRWIFSRPPRVQTLLSVRAALAQRN